MGCPIAHYSPVFCQVSPTVHIPQWYTLPNGTHSSMVHPPPIVHTPQWYTPPMVHSPMVHTPQWYTLPNGKHPPPPNSTQSLMVHTPQWYTIHNATHPPMVRMRALKRGRCLALERNAVNPARTYQLIIKC